MLSLVQVNKIVNINNKTLYFLVSDESQFEFYI